MDPEPEAPLHDNLLTFLTFGLVISALSDDIFLFLLVSPTSIFVSVEVMGTLDSLSAGFDVLSTGVVSEIFEDILIVLAVGVDVTSVDLADVTFSFLVEF